MSLITKVFIPLCNMLLSEDVIQFLSTLSTLLWASWQGSHQVHLAEQITNAYQSEWKAAGFTLFMMQPSAPKHGEITGNRRYIKNPQSCWSCFMFKWNLQRFLPYIIHHSIIIYKPNKRTIEIKTYPHTHIHTRTQTNKIIVILMPTAMMLPWICLHCLAVAALNNLSTDGPTREVPSPTHTVHSCMQLISIHTPLCKLLREEGDT